MVLLKKFKRWEDKRREGLLRKLKQNITTLFDLVTREGYMIEEWKIVSECVSESVGQL